MTAAVGIVAAMQAIVLALGGAGFAVALGAWPAMSFVTGGACMVAATATYGACLALGSHRDAKRTLRTHFVAQATKVAVAVTLLIAGLNSRWDFAPGAYVAGFAAAVLAYPFALLLVNRKTDRN